MRTHRWVSLSRTLKNDTPCYNGAKGVEVAAERSMARGDAVNSLALRMSNHAGTHIDFPRHFIRGGRTLDDYAPDHFIFSSVAIVDAPLADGVYIDEAPLKRQARAAGAELLLIRTGYGRYYGTDKYWNDNPGLSARAAQYIRNAFPRLRAIGVDFISINAYRDKGEGRRAHAALLAAPEILIIEDMDLTGLTGRPSLVVAAPLPLAGADGAPCSVIARLSG